MSTTNSDKLRKSKGQKDFSKENIAALDLFQDCVNQGYTIRVDNLTVTKDGINKIVSLKPSQEFRQKPMKDKEIVAWNRGWNSASSLAEETLQELLSHAQYSPETLSYNLPKENLEALKTKMQTGLYKNMRVGSRAGLNYYLVNTKNSIMTSEDRIGKS